MDIQDDFKVHPMSLTLGQIHGIILSLSSMVINEYSELQLVTMKGALEAYKKTYSVPEGGADPQSFRKGTDMVLDALIGKCDEGLGAIQKGKESTKS